MSIMHALRTRQLYMRMSRQTFSNKVAKTISQTCGKALKSPVYPGMSNTTRKKLRCATDVTEALLRKFLQILPTSPRVLLQM